jgi:crossover junction endodeoxyribonuclease RusA
MIFPFPNPRLSPNKRIDRRSLIGDKQIAKQIGFVITKRELLYLRPVPLELKIIIFPPDNRRRDDDNIYLSFKPYRDGIFQALELDDKLIRRTVIEWGEVKPDGELIVEITEI